MTSLYNEALSLYEANTDYVGEFAHAFDTRTTYGSYYDDYNTDRDCVMLVDKLDQYSNSNVTMNHIIKHFYGFPIMPGSAPASYYWQWFMTPYTYYKYVSSI